MGILVGSARIDENGKIANGRAGDQTGREVATENFYVHPKGWNIIRAKNASHAGLIATKMIQACNNANIGYDQNQRLGVISNGIGTTKPTECDCSSLVRACVKEATGKDPGNFNTSSEKATLLRTGLFEDAGSYVSGTKLYNGDILVTKTKGHTVVVVSGANVRSSGNIPSTNNSPNKVDAAESLDKKLAGTYRTTANLNLRAGADRNKVSLAIIPKGGRVECYGYYATTGDVKWLYVSYNNLTGYCSSKYLSKV